MEGTALASEPLVPHEEELESPSAERRALIEEGRAEGLAAGSHQSGFSSFFSLFTAVYSWEKRSKALRAGTSERQNTCV